jgi:hypothetical protein
MLDAVDEAISRSRRRPGPGRLSFAAQAFGATALSSFIATQALMVAVNWPDLSFWGFAIYLSFLIAAVAGLAGLIADIVVWLVGARLLPTGARVAVIALTHLAAALGAQVALATILSASPMLQNPVVALGVIVPAAIGAAVAAIAVWRHRPEGPFEANIKRRQEAWLARSRS